MSAELKDCPFCGGRDIFIEPDERGSGGQHVAPYHVGCAACKCEQCHDDRDEAISAWNRRTSPAPGAPGQEAAVSWQVRRTDGSPLACWETCTKDLYDLTLSTGRYCGFENGPPCEVRALGVIAALPPSGAGEKTS